MDFLIYFLIYVFDCRSFCGTRDLQSSCGRCDLVLRPGMEPKPPVLGARSLSHWTTRKVPGFLENKIHQVIEKIKNLK